jgi:methyl-accepting chemotaxis protein
MANYTETATKEDFTSGRFKYFMFGLIPSNPQAAGGGIWFEPYKFDSEQRYYGPFIYIEDGKPVYTDEYSSGSIDYHSEDWYINGVNSDGGVVWSDIYVDPVSKVTMVTVTQPFYDPQGQFFGNTTVDMDLTDIKNMIGNVKIGKTGKAFLVGSGGEYISYFEDSKTMDMQIQNDSEPALAALGKMVMSQDRGTSTLNLDGTTYQASYATIPDLDWHMIALVDQAELTAENQRMSALLIVVTLITLAIMIYIIMYLARYLRKNLNKIEGFSKIAASGNFTNHLDIETKDEFNLIAQHLNFMVESMDGMSNESAKMLDSSRNLIAEISKSSHEVSSDSLVIADSASVLVYDSSQQVNSLDDIAKEAENIIMMTTENVSKTADANVLAVQIRDVAQSGQMQMNEMVDAVKSISASSANISKVIKVIDDIAFQTNILALNAAVEAARANQHGKGFAVVAEEVRNLAAKSAEAAKETEELISDTVEKAAVGAKIADATSASLNKIVVGINQSAEIMGSISNANEKQAGAVKNITDQIQCAREIARKNAHAAGEASDSAKKMNAQSDLLDSLVRKYGN